MRHYGNKSVKVLLFTAPFLISVLLGSEWVLFIIRFVTGAEPRYWYFPNSSLYLSKKEEEKGKKQLNLQKKGLYLSVNVVFSTEEY